MRAGRRSVRCLFCPSKAERTKSNWSWGLGRSKPVAITVRWISPPTSGSTTAPKMMLHSGWALARITSAASLTSKRLMSSPPLMLKMIERAPSIDTSNRALSIARLAASRARFSPVPRPIAIKAAPPSCMIVLTSAKSKLIKPGTVISSLIPWMPWRRTSSAMPKACLTLADLPAICRSRSLGMEIRVSTEPCSVSIECSALRRRWVPSKVKGRVTTPIVRAPSSRATWATTVEAPEPVPPPIPAVTKTMSAPLSIWRSSSRLSSAARRPISGLPPEPSPLVIFSPMRSRWGALESINACASVLTAMNSTPWMPSSIMRLTAF